MAFDGITTNCIMQELNHLLAGQRISKIAQPEREELLFTFKALNEGSNRLLISANASLPFLYMTKENKTSPLNISETDASVRSASLLWNVCSALPSSIWMKWAILR